MMRHAKSWELIVILPLAILLGCSGESGPKDNPGSARLYEIKGKVMAVNSTKPAVTLDHEDIPGLMKAMQMEFEVKDGKLLDGIKPGDQVKGELQKDSSGYVITKLEKR